MFLGERDLQDLLIDIPADDFFPHRYLGPTCGPHGTSRPLCSCLEASIEQKGVIGWKMRAQSAPAPIAYLARASNEALAYHVTPLRLHPDPATPQFLAFLTSPKPYPRHPHPSERTLFTTSSPFSLGVQGCTLEGSPRRIGPLVSHGVLKRAAEKQVDLCSLRVIKVRALLQGTQFDAVFVLNPIDAVPIAILSQ
jgi:hypothetical protein